MAWLKQHLINAILAVVVRQAGPIYWYQLWRA